MTSPEPTLDEFAAGQMDGTDVRVLAAVAGLYDVLDPVPTGLVDRITFAITLDALNAEVAQLQRSGDLVGARADEVTDAQTVTFTSSSLTTMVTITPRSGDRVRIDGWVAPGAGASVEARVDALIMHTTADADGRFVFEDVPRGMAQFLLRPPSGETATPVVTPTIQL